MILKKVFNKLFNKLISPVPFDFYFVFQKQTHFQGIKQNFRQNSGYIPDINCPKTFNEKLTHRKLYCRDEIWVTVTDKVAVRDYLLENGLPDGLHLIPVIEVFDSLEKLREANLPKEFIAKAAWASGKNFIVRDFEIQRNQLLKQVKRWFQEYKAYGKRKLIWPAQSIQRRIIIEELLQDTNGEPPPDYKFFVFHGKCQFFQIDTGRHNKHERSLFTRDAKPLNLIKSKVPASSKIDIPLNLSKMIEVSESLAQNFDFVRVDLYVSGTKIYFGEFTQTPGNGCGAFDPVSFDLKFGEYWNYPLVK